jgi:hypothetical protein
VPPAPATVAIPAWRATSVSSHALFSCVSSLRHRRSSGPEQLGGALSDAFEKIRDDAPALTALIRAAFDDERRRAARERNTEQVVGAAVGRREQDVAAVARKDEVRDRQVRRLEHRSLRVVFRSITSRYQRSDSKPGLRWARTMSDRPSAVKTGWRPRRDSR